MRAILPYGTGLAHSLIAGVGERRSVMGFGANRLKNGLGDVGLRWGSRQ